MRSVFDYLAEWIWATLVFIVVSGVSMFYRHGGRLSAVEAVQAAEKEQRTDMLKWMKTMSKDIVEIKVNTARGRNGKRRR